jgi:NAD(P)-dependent dehydrogenase (short-subunit alcohol dehydrogenase family)
MIAQGIGGGIVYISSKNSVFTGPNNVAYGSAKADQAHQVRLLAAELGQHGIKVNGINPTAWSAAPGSSPAAGAPSAPPSTPSPKTISAPTTPSAPCWARRCCPNTSPTPS